MSVGPRGISRDEIRELVHEYYVQPYGTRKEWLASQPVTEWTFRRWRKMIQEGDLDRNLIPREHGNMARTNGEWSAFEKARAREIAEHQSEVEQLKGRIRELEGTNYSSGKSYRALARVERARARYGPDERSERFIEAENLLVRELTQLTGSQRQALEFAGVSRSTWHYRQNPREQVQDPLGQSERAYESRISTEDRDRISEYIHGRLGRPGLR